MARITTITIEYFIRKIKANQVQCTPATSSSKILAWNLDYIYFEQENPKAVLFFDFFNRRSEKDRCLIFQRLKKSTAIMQYTSSQTIKKGTHICKKEGYSCLEIYTKQLYWTRSVITEVNRKYKRIALSWCSYFCNPKTPTQLPKCNIAVGLNTIHSTPL